MQLGHSELPWRDPRVSASFFVEVLAFELEDNQGDRFIWLKRDGWTVLLRPGQGGEPQAGQSFVLYSQDVPQEVSRLRALGLRLQLEGTCWHFHDPDDRLWQLVNPLDDHSQP